MYYVQDNKTNMYIVCKAYLLLFFTHFKTCAKYAHTDHTLYLLLQSVKYFKCEVEVM